MSDEPTSSRGWTTFWDRSNRRVILLAGPLPGEHHWDWVKHDDVASVAGVYDIWRCGDEIVVVEVRLDAGDSPLGFPRHLLDESLLGSPTIWPLPKHESFIWWHPPHRRAPSSGGSAPTR